jgi:uncharacterized membrane protein YfcA
MDAVTIMLILLGIFAAVFGYIFFIGNKMAPGVNGKPRPLWISGVIGFVTNFFDTLGIGSFAPTTAAFKATKVVDDGVIPGTLNVAHTIPVVFMAFLYISSVEVEMVTLISLIAASVLGAWLGAGVVAKFNKRRIQLVLGVALIVVAGVMALRNAGVISRIGEGNVDVGLSGAWLVAGIVAHFVLGALMTAGVGLYAPSMAVVYLLGLSPAVAFPVMMGACAFLMPVAGVKFIKEGKYARNQSLAIAILGIPGVWLAFQFFSGLFNLGLLIWLVIIVIFITSLMMLREAVKAKGAK